MMNEVSEHPLNHVPIVTHRLERRVNVDERNAVLQRYFLDCFVVSDCRGRIFIILKLVALRKSNEHDLLAFFDRPERNLFDTILKSLKIVRAVRVIIHPESDEQNVI